MSKLHWYDIISKAPRPQTYGDRFKFTDWSALPEPLKYFIMDKTNGAVAWLNMGAYEGMRLESIKVEDPPYTDNTKLHGIKSSFLIIFCKCIKKQLSNSPISDLNIFSI